MESFKIYSIDNLDILSTHAFSLTNAVSQVSAAVVREVGDRDDNAVIPAVDNIIGNGGIVFEDGDKGDRVGCVIQCEEGDRAAVDVVEKIAGSGRCTVMERVWNHWN